MTYNYFEDKVQEAAGLGTIHDKLELLLYAIKDKKRGIRRAKLDRPGLAHYLRTSTRLDGLDDEQWRVIKNVFSNHVAPYFTTGTQEERDAFAKNLPWLFRPEEIMAYGLSTGCASTAPVFAVLARMVGLKVRLAISVLASDFLIACDTPGEPRKLLGMDGHQIVMAQKGNGKWSALNTSIGREQISRARYWWAKWPNPDSEVLEWDLPEYAVDTWVIYPGVIPDGKTKEQEYVIRAVESSKYDLLLVRNFDTCKNVQASGKHNDPTVRALPPRRFLQNLNQE